MNKLSAILYNDDDLLSSTTDGVFLYREQEHHVTEAISALRHLLSSRNDSSCRGTPVKDLNRNAIVLEYLSYFSSGLLPGEARYILFRYLKANGMSIKRALREMTRAVEMIEEQQLHNVTLCPCMIPTRGFDEFFIGQEIGYSPTNTTCENHHVEYNRRNPKENLQGNACRRHSEEKPYDVKTTEVTHESALPAIPRTTNNLSARATAMPRGAANFTALGKSTHPLSTFLDAESKTSDYQRARESWWFFPSILSFVYGEGLDRRTPASSSDTPTTASLSSRTRSNGSFFSTISIGGDGSDNEVTDKLQTQDTDEVFVDHSEGLVLPVGKLYGSMYTYSLNWRYAVESILQIVRKHVPFAFHYCDMEGRPVLYFRLGQLNSRTLRKEIFSLSPVDAEPRALVAVFLTYIFLVVEQLIRYCNRRNYDVVGQGDAHSMVSWLARQKQQTAEFSRLPAGATTVPSKVRVGSCTIVIDCAGVKGGPFLYTPLLAILRSAIQTNMPLFPELVHHIYVVNCTAVVRLSYLFLRPVLQQRTSQKITFIGKKSTAATLCQHISSHLVPSELGGGCKCVGGCIPSLAPSDDVEPATSQSPKTSYSSSILTSPHARSGIDMICRYDEDERAGRCFHCTCKRIFLKGRGSHSVCFAMDANKEFIWDFLVKSNNAVTFTAFFVSGGNDGMMFSLAQGRRVRVEAGHYICPSIGTIILKWSNEHIFSRCLVNIKVYCERGCGGSF